jgi:hypothetical protein
VNIITEETFPMYFAGDKLASMYGFTGEFVVEIQQWAPPHLITILVSV